MKLPKSQKQIPMKKLFAFMKAKESVEKTTPSNKKSNNEKETKVVASAEQKNSPPRELYSGEYNDIGYC
jgi:hypothetical protein